jgi:NCAIR mutase (PurE)-related protein
MKIENLPNNPFDITRRAVEFTGQPEVVKAAIEDAEQEAQALKATLDREETELTARQDDSRRLAQLIKAVTETHSEKIRKGLEEIALCPCADTDAIGQMIAASRNTLRAATEAERLMKLDMLPTQSVAVLAARAEYEKTKAYLARLDLLACQVEFLILSEPLIAAQGSPEIGLSPKAAYLSDCLIRANARSRGASEEYVNENTKLQQLKKDAMRLAL